MITILDAMVNNTVKSFVANNLAAFNAAGNIVAAVTQPKAIGFTVDRNNKSSLTKAGKILPRCVVTHRREPGEFREYLLQQTTLSQAAESCKSRRKVQRIDGE